LYEGDKKGKGKEAKEKDEDEKIGDK